jgi:acyl carrier protein
MKEEDLLIIINEILEEDCEDSLKELKPSYNLREDVGFDSLSLAQLTVKIESVYGIDIFADGIINTVQEIYDKVNRK